MTHGAMKETTRRVFAIVGENMSVFSRKLGQGTCVNPHKTLFFLLLALALIACTHSSTLTPPPSPSARGSY